MASLAPGRQRVVFAGHCRGYRQYVYLVPQDGAEGGRAPGLLLRRRDQPPQAGDERGHGNGEDQAYPENSGQVGAHQKNEQRVFDDAVAQAQKSHGQEDVAARELAGARFADQQASAFSWLRAQASSEESVLAGRHSMAAGSRRLPVAE